METLHFQFDGGRVPAAFAPALVGVVSSGNLEVLVEPAPGTGCRIDIDTSARGFGAIWEAVLRDFHARHAVAGVAVSIHDMGATPAVVSLRLDQAMSAVWGSVAMSVSFAEMSARERLAAIVDAGSFHEWLAPSERVTSPHLAQLGVPAAFDDGVAIGRAALAGRPIFVAAQEGEFMGGGVGEVHGAKLVGLLRRALRDRPDAVVLLAESGGVRLHEANAGLIAVSEVMRALLDVRAAGIATVALIGGANGCFGGMGIVARCADAVVMSDIARHAMSGPEVIESSNGAGEFDSRDRALVWRTTGGKHRWLTGDCDLLVDDDPAAFRAAAIAALDARRPATLAALRVESTLLQQRVDVDGDNADAVELWTRLGVDDARAVPDLDAAAVRALRPAALAALANGGA